MPEDSRAPRQVTMAAVTTDGCGWLTEGHAWAVLSCMLHSTGLKGAIVSGLLL